MEDNTKIKEAVAYLDSLLTIGGSLTDIEQLTFIRTVMGGFLTPVMIQPGELREAIDEDDRTAVRLAEALRAGSPSEHVLDEAARFIEYLSFGPPDGDDMSSFS
jgi:hypothetical protein